MDIEFDNMFLIQAAGLVFKMIDEKQFKYQLQTSFNFYIKRDKVGKYAEKITGINPQFLNDNGIPLEEFRQEFNNIISEMDLNDSLFVSHGTKNDRSVLKFAGIEKLPAHSFCTYKNAAKILKRDKKLSLSDIADEAGWKSYNNHDAFSDALATTVVFSFLKNKEGE
jgi:DNA polymerase III epsilon subunit-like protein